jgi:hypothetical protein
MEHLSERSLKPHDHSDQGLYRYGPDEDASTLWEQQTENIPAIAPPSRSAALGPQQIRRKRARRATTQHDRNLNLVRAIVAPSSRGFVRRGVG